MFVILVANPNLPVNVTSRGAACNWNPRPRRKGRVRRGRSGGRSQNADITVLVLGEGQAMIGEATSGSTFVLPGRQQELLDAVTAPASPSRCY
jgi:hypothetical protein